MIIILGSKNPAKKRSIELALKELGISKPTIICVNSESSVPTKPIGYEIIRGADNRNQASKEYAIKSRQEYDYLCAIEGGFSLDENGLPFVVTYAIVEDNNGKKSTGKSLGLRLQKNIFDFLKEGGSVNSAIGMITGAKNNKQDQGLTGYLTGGLLSREKFDKDAVISAFIPIIFNEEKEALSEKVKQIKYS